LFSLLALASVDLVTGGVYLGRFWEALVTTPLQWGGLATNVFLAFFAPGIATVVVAIAAHVTRSPYAGGVRAILSIVHVALGAVFVVLGASSGLISCPSPGMCTEISVPDWFLVAPGLALIVVGVVSLAWFRLKP
jgi:hypothetical protein